MADKRDKDAEIKELERVLAEQKGRIFDLKNELTMSEKQIAKYKSKSEQMSKALMNAVGRADEIEYLAFQKYKMEMAQLKNFHDRWMSYYNKIIKKYPLDKDLQALADFNQKMNDIIGQPNPTSLISNQSQKQKDRDTVENNTVEPMRDNVGIEDTKPIDSNNNIHKHSKDNKIDNLVNNDKTNLSTKTPIASIADTILQSKTVELQDKELDQFVRSKGKDNANLQPNTNDTDKLSSQNSGSANVAQDNFLSELKRLSKNSQNKNFDDTLHSLADFDDILQPVGKIKQYIDRESKEWQNTSYQGVQQIQVNRTNTAPNAATSQYDKDSLYDVNNESATAQRESYSPTLANTDISDDIKTGDYGKTVQLDYQEAQNPKQKLEDIMKELGLMRD